jgi:glycosyltransferase involved in cell wall biosynthesis
MLISICIPTFNRIVDLKLCIASVVAACTILNEPVEILVSDNASPDGTHEWLNSLNIKEKNIKFVYWKNKENIGAIKNIKKLIESANGEYLFFLTDDDLMMPNALIVLKKIIIDSSPGFVKFATITYLKKSKKSYFYGHRQSVDDRKILGNFLMIEKYAHVLSGCAVKNCQSLLNTLKDSSNVYPSIEMCAYNAGSCMYINDPIVIHNWENDLFWELDVNLSSAEAKSKHLIRDSQLALLNISIINFDKKTKKLFLETILGRYGYIEDGIIKKFKLNTLQLILIYVKVYPVYIFSNFLSDTKTLIFSLIRSFKR